LPFDVRAKGNFPDVRESESERRKAMAISDKKILLVLPLILLLVSNFEIADKFAGKRGGDAEEESSRSGWIVGKA